MLKKPLVLLALTLLPLTGCNTLPPPDVTPVQSFQLERYQGRWYEIARLDHRFERGLQAVSADYSRNTDGSIRVVNRGFDTAAASWREAVGKAWFNGPADVASLKVSFFGPFYGGYHVAELDPDYRWAVVVGPDKNYLWLLSRDKQPAPEAKTALLAVAAKLGIPAEKLIWVSQNRGDN
ncbi:MULTISPECIES: lipocalin family protein [Chromobacterium]|uniref:lipocalin family protein n=1 Tax=Chromobacterium TaxID=535 RepID=UPI001888E94E|nr:MULTISPECIES: lipocalin family protein [Chromobacterium]QOZ84471.1 lipocalin [Chromobacterium sp. Rain0013]WON84652.1 lipocalin family protein [Chromobacterium haemolyticum]